ncbi:MAG TPA: hypothetical protein VK921_10870 [Anditalea sp.]|nr:hypothetical protein [Anditalea sp.]
MKKSFTILLLSFIYFINHADAQQALEVELYGGPGLSHFRVEEHDPEKIYSFGSSISGHFGVNFLTKLNSKWQLATQVEYMQSTGWYDMRRDPQEVYYILEPQAARFNRYLNYSLGLRYNHQVKNKIFFAQGAIGGTENLFGDNQNMHGNKPHLTLRVETGVKIYNKKNNYFVFGLRHQQGINRNTGKTSVNIFSDQGSFTGLFVGYGIGSKSQNSIFK